MVASLEKYIKKERFEIGREIFISIFIATIVSGTVTFYFNRAIDSKVANRQMMYEFSRTFFDTPKYRDVSIALEESYLYNRGPVMKVNGGNFNDYQIDDYLIHLTELYLFGKEGFVSFDLLNDQFGYHICVTYKNKEIKDYMSRLKSQGFTDPFKTIDDFAKELNITEDTDCKKIIG